eukprot:scaffold482_cov266-Amphora_coffeaeformis.AAC.6
MPMRATRQQDEDLFFSQSSCHSSFVVAHHQAAMQSQTNPVYKNYPTMNSVITPIHTEHGGVVLVDLLSIRVEWDRRDAEHLDEWLYNDNFSGNDDNGERLDKCEMEVMVQWSPKSRLVQLAYVEGYYMASEKDLWDFLCARHVPLRKITLEADPGNFLRRGEPRDDNMYDATNAMAVKFIMNLQAWPDFPPLHLILDDLHMSRMIRQVENPTAAAGWIIPNKGRVSSLFYDKELVQHAQGSAMVELSYMRGAEDEDVITKFHQVLSRSLGRIHLILSGYISCELLSHLTNDIYNDGDSNVNVQCLSLNWMRFCPTHLAELLSVRKLPHLCFQRHSFSPYVARQLVQHLEHERQKQGSHYPGVHLKSLQFRGCVFGLRHAPYLLELFGHFQRVERLEFQNCRFHPVAIGEIWFGLTNLDDSALKYLALHCLDELWLISAFGKAFLYWWQLNKGCKSLVISARRTSWTNVFEWYHFLSRHEKLRLDWNFGDAACLVIKSRSVDITVSSVATFQEIAEANGTRWENQNVDHHLILNVDTITQEGRRASKTILPYSRLRSLKLHKGSMIETLRLLCDLLPEAKKGVVSLEIEWNRSTSDDSSEATELIGSLMHKVSANTSLLSITGLSVASSKLPFLQFVPIRNRVHSAKPSAAALIPFLIASFPVGRAFDPSRRTCIDTRFGKRLTATFVTIQTFLDEIENVWKSK